MITTEQLEFIIENTKIALTDEEKQKLLHELNSAMELFADIDDAIVANVEPLFYPNMQEYTFREDTMEMRNSREELLGNTTDAENGYFKFPAVLKGESENNE